jgi:hypothetical protein
LPCGVLVQGAHPGITDALPGNGALPLPNMSGWTLRTR